jgi:hypothetical protein
MGLPPAWFEVPSESSDEQAPVSTNAQEMQRTTLLAGTKALDLIGG